MSAREAGSATSNPPQEYAMFDPTETQAAFASAHEFNKKTTESMAAPFLAGSGNATIDSASTVSAIILGSQNVGAQMLAQMVSIKNSNEAQLAAHQLAQRQQKTYDFVTNMDDLRNTIAQGFPEEMADQFFSTFDMKSSG
jgi:protein-tyrosine-phosphatase